VKTRIRKISPQGMDPALIREAAQILERGGLVVFPTETVYGIATNLLQKEAVERLKQFKERPETKHFSVHIGDIDDVDRHAVDVLPRARKLMHRFWPGPLTLVLPAPEGRRVGLRLPDHEVALALLRSVDSPVIAPSANRSGQPAPRTVADALGACDGYVEMVLDAGPTPLGTESTVVDACTLPVSILREGALSADDVLRVASQKTVLFVCTGNSCRSVMGEYLLKKKLQEWGRSDVDVLSAGTGAFPGNRPTRETLDLVEGLGLNAAQHAARRLTRATIEEADIILAMETRHQEDILRLVPEAKDRTHVLGRFTGLAGPEAEISDPIGSSVDVYHLSFLKIQRAVSQLKDKI